MKSINLKIQPKQTRTKMTSEELEKYMNEVRKSSHVFRNKKKYDRKRIKREIF